MSIKSACMRLRPVGGPDAREAATGGTQVSAAATWGSTSNSVTFGEARPHSGWERDSAIGDCACAAAVQLRALHRGFHARATVQMCKTHALVFVRQPLTRICPCPLKCGQKIRWNQREAHFEHDCPEFEVKCAHGCGASMPRHEVPGHIEECNYALVSCPIASCSVQVRRSELRDHLASSMAAHMMLLSETVAKQSLIIKTQAAAIADLQKHRFCGILQTPDSVTFPITNVYSTLDRAQVQKTKIRSPRYMLENGLHFELEVVFDHLQVSVYLSLQPGPYDNLLEWPFSARYTISILDQSSIPEHIERSVHPERHGNSQAFRRKEVGCMMVLYLRRPGRMVPQKEGASEGAGWVEGGCPASQSRVLTTTTPAQHLDPSTG